MKFQRNYELTIETPLGVSITITPTFSIVFNITRNVHASANSCQISLYNLKKSTRRQIYKDRYSTTEYWKITLKAGYGTKLREVFTGNILEASSTKQGVDWITTISSFDGLDAIQNGYVSTTLSKGTTLKEAVKSVVGNMPNLVTGVLGGDLEKDTSRGQVIMGQLPDAMGTLTGGNYFIDNETLNVLTDDEVISGDVLYLDSNSLLETPKRQDTYLTVPVLFTPEINVGQICEVSSIEDVYDGQYKVIGFNHSVTISQAIAGTARTELQLNYGADGLKEVLNA